LAKPLHDGASGEGDQGASDAMLHADAIGTSALAGAVDPARRAGGGRVWRERPAAAARSGHRVAQ
jgi:hypothetical protein